MAKKSTISMHQAGLEIWNKDSRRVKAKKYADAPRGFRKATQDLMVKVLKCKPSSAATYIQHYARHGAPTWDYMSQTAPRYKALKTGKSVKAKNGSKVKYVKAGKKAAKTAPRKGGKGARATA